MNDRHSVTVMGWYSKDATSDRFVCTGADQRVVELFGERTGTARLTVSREDFARDFSVIQPTDAERAWAGKLLETLWAEDGGDP